LLSETIATPISAVLMAKDPWIPFWISSIIIVIGLCQAFLLPETLEVSKQKSLGDSERTFEQVSDEANRGWFGYIVHSIKDAAHSTGFIWKDVNVMLILFVFFVGTLGRQAMALLLLYVSKKYGWSIARVSRCFHVLRFANTR
jgi:hypothetical protein